jgi:hypothetical protein
MFLFKLKIIKIYFSSSSLACSAISLSIRSFSAAAFSSASLNLFFIKN